MAILAPYQQIACPNELLGRPDEFQDSCERDGYPFSRGSQNRAEADYISGKLLAAKRAENMNEELFEK